MVHPERRRCRRRRRCASQRCRCWAVRAAAGRARRFPRCACWPWASSKGTAAVQGMGAPPGLTLPPRWLCPHQFGRCRRCRWRTPCCPSRLRAACVASPGGAAVSRHPDHHRTPCACRDVSFDHNFCRNMKPLPDVVAVVGTFADHISSTSDAAAALKITFGCRPSQPWRCRMSGRQRCQIQHAAALHSQKQQ